MMGLEPVWVEPIAPPAKRPRQQAIADSTYATYPPRVHEEVWTQAGEDDGPRTLHIGGLPESMGQAEAEEFFTSNYQSNFIGCKLTPGARDGKGSPAGRAFVGFVSHQVAATVLAEIDGFSLHGATLRAEWA